jgi:DNA invertase Pin-like site-specific DNA recombinase
MFNIIGAMAEFERELIREPVKAGMKNAKAKGTRIGRPRVIVDAARIAALRASGLSWPSIAGELGLSVGTVYQAARRLSKNPAESAPPTD